MGGVASQAPVAVRYGLVDRIRSGAWRLRWILASWLTRRALDLVVWLQRDSNYLRHLEREARKWFEGPDGPNRWIAEGTRDLLAVFASQGHSGGSYAFAVEFFAAMARFKPWGPLTGEDDEWSEPFDQSGIRQNLRCSHVFLHPDGTAYDSQGRVFVEPNGVAFTSHKSRVPITFPYTPKVEYVHVGAPGEEDKDG